MNSFPIIFDKRKVKKNQDNSSLYFDNELYYTKEIRLNLIDKLNDINKKFHSALLLGNESFEIGRILQASHDIKNICYADISERNINKLQKYTKYNVCFDEELLPFKEKTFDLIIANFSLQWANDLPGTLIQLRKSLKQDGLLLATFPGGSTLNELRISLANAEIETSGGVTPRVSPFVDIKDAGNLLVRAGYTLPVAEVDYYNLEFKNMFTLLNTLKSTGQSNALVARTKNLTPLNFFKKTEKLYIKDFSLPNNKIKATLEVVTLTGWSPSSNQQKPLPRGSATHSLADFINKGK